MSRKAPERSACRRSVDRLLIREIRKCRSPSSGCASHPPDSETADLAAGLEDRTRLRGERTRGAENRHRNGGIDGDVHVGNVDQRLAGRDRIKVGVVQFNWTGLAL